MLNDHYCFSKGDEYGVSRNDIMDAAYDFCNEHNPSKDPWDQFDFNDANGRDESWFGQDNGVAIEFAAPLLDGCLVASDEDGGISAMAMVAVGAQSMLVVSDLP